MKQNEYQIIKQYVGIELLKFILNRNDITAEHTIDKLDLSKTQEDILNDLNSKIKYLRIQHIVQGGYGDGLEFGLSSLTDNSLFNNYREACGGGYIKPKQEDDPLINFLYKVAKRNYPNLLIKSSSINRILNSNFFLRMPDYEEFIKLVKSDVINKLTNKKDGLDYCFKFTTNSGMKFFTQVASASSILITRSFANCCNEMKFDFESLITEIEHNVEMLRLLAENKEITFNSYVGLKGLTLFEFSKIELSNSSLFQLTSLSNPSIHTNRIVTTHNSGDEKYLSGCILKIKHLTKVSSLESDTNYGLSPEIANEQDKILRALKFALVFTLKEDRGVIPSFYETGFPLVPSGNYSSSNEYPQKYFKLDNSNLTDFQEWYEKLLNIDLKYIQTTIKRLEYAIFGRKTPEDAIMDAIIAWEGMFSEAFETTFKVTGSIAKYLVEDIDKRDEFLSRLKKLYALRSEIVHGKKSKLLEKENIEELRSEVIEIGLSCLSKLLQDKDLLKLSPPERIKKILVMN